MADHAESIAALSQLLRRVDGNHTKGADKLAEEIVTSQWYYSEIAAAEQRGAERGWDEGAAVGADFGAEAIVPNPMHHNPYREDDQ